MFRFVKKWLLQGARIHAVGRLVPLVLTMFSFFVPDKIRKDYKHFFCMNHPTDIDNHVLIIPVEYYSNLKMFLLDHQMCHFLYLLLKENKCFSNNSIVLCNWGNRQEVQQVHFHCLSLSSIEIDLYDVINHWTKTESKECYYNYERGIIAVSARYLNKQGELIDIINRAQSKLSEGGSVIFYEL